MFEFKARSRISVLEGRNEKIQSKCDDLKESNEKLKDEVSGLSKITEELKSQNDKVCHDIFVFVIVYVFCFYCS